ncbi:ABC transporter ATP-binding protein [Butyrivibrio sp. LB2008]|uniref:ABC transporter ATP-binding protein n=1 Tax=Butyrivibrio sp. LB2008 TaxID=1408305 RepID=UPI000685EA34|nr:ATP-binding cassette domain-containing protein [Butyrivibrio sp. LB2008]
MEPLLSIKNLHKSKKGKNILSDVNIELHKGEIVGFIGANGAGKTTTMKCMMGLYSFEGKIEKGEIKVGALIEEPCFYPYMSGIRNLKIDSMYYKDVSKKRIEDIVKELDMSQYIGQKVKRYSLGMKQRLGLAFALMDDPDVIILDEPMNGLDPQGVVVLRNTLKKLAHEKNKAILISSHILSEMQVLCDRFVFIKDGRTFDIQTDDDLEKKYMEIMEEGMELCLNL